MKRVLLALLAFLVLPAPAAFAEPAVVRSEVNLRTAPNMSDSRVIGTLKPGEEVSVECARGWCELLDGRGYVATRFLSLGEGGGGPTAPAALPAAAAQPEAVAAPDPEAGGIFHGVWTVRSDAAADAASLTIQQSGTNALGTMVVGDITTTMAGRIEGTQFIFTWENTQAGQVVVAGEGYLNFVGEGALSGFLLHNGSVMAAMTARR